MQPEVLRYFADYIERELGIVYAEDSYFQLQNRLEQVAGFYGLPGVRELHEKAKAGLTGSFRQYLLDIATNNETLFFRDPRIFASLEKAVLPNLFDRGPSHRPFRIWSAAASTGQEIYSVAILLNELAGKRLVPPVEFLGTDVSERALERARSGRYSQLEIQRGLSAPLLVKYFTKDPEDYWTVKDVLRKGIQFKSLNLRGAIYDQGDFDLILCRNLLIYQRPEAKADILRKLFNRLTPGGFLVLGTGETLIGIFTEFEQVYFDSSPFYRRPISDQSVKKAA